MAHTTTYDIRTHQALELAAQGKPPSAVARDLGISPRHARRLLAEPAAKLRLRELQDQRLAGLLEAALSAAPTALDALRKASENPLAPASARVAAARAMLRGLLELLDAVDTAGRVADLEQRIRALAERDDG